MNNLILNRETFKLPEDGWYQLAPLGEFAHAGAGVIQVIDAEACVAMAARFAADAAVENFAGLLIDFDHFSMQGGQRSEAAGWITALEAGGQGSGFGVQGSGEHTSSPSSEGSRNGLWAQIRWSDLGEAAVKGGRYRFLSPVWTRGDCVDLGVDPASGLPRLRPVRLLNAAVTNDPNLKGLKALSNRSQETEVRSQNGERQLPPLAKTGGPEQTGEVGRVTESLEKLQLDNGMAHGARKGAFMKTVIERLLNHLGLATDTAEAVVLEKLGTLPALSAVTDLQNSLRDLQTKHDALVANLKAVEGELVNRHLAEFEGIVTEKSRAFWAAELISNRAGALAALTDLRELTGKETPTPDPSKEGSGNAGARKPLHNRATARPLLRQGFAGQACAAGDETDGRAVKIRNRAHEIAKAEGVPFGVAFQRAEREVIGQ